MSAQPLFEIEEVARDTGIGKDTLRVWERRYGFPTPLRSEQGQRHYPIDQVDQLRAIKRLLDLGYRPGKIVSLTPEQLEQLPDQDLSESSDKPENGRVRELLKLARSPDPLLLRPALESELRKSGLEQFTRECAAPLIFALGEAWAFSGLPVYAEHRASHCLISVLTEAIARQKPTANGKRVVLATIPGERHLLGLLMAEAILASRGAVTVNLGAETPVTDMAAAVSHYQSDVLALSFSQIQNRAIVLDSLTSLCKQLPPGVDIVAGGRNIKQLKKLPRRVQVLDLDHLGDWITPS